MILRLKIGFLLFSALLLTGCPQEEIFSARVTNTKSNNFHLVFGDRGESRNTFTRKNQCSKIISISFSRMSGRRGTEIWKIESMAGSGQDLSELTYGKVPKGFIAGSPQVIYPGDRLNISVYCKYEDRSGNVLGHSWMNSFQVTE